MPDKTTTEPSGTCRCSSARGLIKTFGRVVGLDGADFDLNPHEILAVIGDNGAGKSTLIKCLTGAMQPDEGVVQIDGRPVAFRRPQDARDAGIKPFTRRSRWLRRSISARTSTSAENVGWPEFLAKSSVSSTNPEW